MNEELILQMIKNHEEAMKCPLADTEDNKQWTNEINALKEVLQENAQLKEQISKAIERLNSKQIRFINEKDYILTDDDLDEIMQIFKINKED